MRLSALLLTALLTAVPAAAHVMSMSTGGAIITGSQLEYILRMPLYEVAHTPDPQTALLRHIRFVSAGVTGRMVNGECHTDRAHDVYLCGAFYRFPAPIETLAVDCTFYEVTVPNHVHLLRAEKSGKQDRAIFDYTFTHANLLFRPPTMFETVLREAAAGAMRALGGAVPVLFLIGLACSARGPRELSLLIAAFLVSQIAIALAGWYPVPRFVDLAGAVVLGYLAIEIVWLPNAPFRWLFAVALGICQGFYLALFLNGSALPARWVLSGAAFVEAGVIATLAACVLRIAWAPAPRIAGAFLLTAACVLFARGY